TTNARTACRPRFPSQTPINGFYRQTLRQRQTAWMSRPFCRRGLHCLSLNHAFRQSLLKVTHARIRHLGVSEVKPREVLEVGEFLEPGISHSRFSAEIKRPEVERYAWRVFEPRRLFRLGR